MQNLSLHHRKDDESVSAVTSTSQEECSICLEPLENGEVIHQLDQCTHKFHFDCIVNTFKQLVPMCPVCKVPCAVLRGDQPNGGAMTWATIDGSIPGFSPSQHIMITYVFPDGVQGPEHPNPGSAYRGLQRAAYLPATPDGFKILSMLKLAFDFGLLFTIQAGSSRLIFNGITHKTRLNGGAQKFGYPDADYLHLVEEQLASVGIIRAMVD